MYNKILKEFVDSKIIIKSRVKLEEYIIFCIANDVKEKIVIDNQTQTAYHHILPKALFIKYKDFIKFPWNKTSLLLNHHYIAHYMLIQAIEEYSQYNAFVGMHGSIKNKDIVLSSIEYKNIVKERNQMNSINLKKEIILNGITTSKAKIRAKKAALTMSAPIIKNNAVTTIRKEANKKQSDTLKSKIIIDGEEITYSDKTKIKEVESKKKTMVWFNNKHVSIYEMAAIKKRATNDIKAKKYKLCCINSDKTINCVPRRYIREISQALLTTSKEKYLGFTSRAKSKLKTDGKEAYIGLYLEEDTVSTIMFDGCIKNEILKLMNTQ